MITLKLVGLKNMSFNMILLYCLRIIPYIEGSNVIVSAKLDLSLVKLK